jgi:hypothetical protein
MDGHDAVYTGYDLGLHPRHGVAGAVGDRRLAGAGQAQHAALHVEPGQPFGRLRIVVEGAAGGDDDGHCAEVHARAAHLRQAFITSGQLREGRPQRRTACGVRPGPCARLAIHPFGEAKAREA